MRFAVFHVSKLIYEIRYSDGTVERIRGEKKLDERLDDLKGVTGVAYLDAVLLGIGHYDPNDKPFFMHFISTGEPAVIGYNCDEPEWRNHKADMAIYRAL